MADNLSIAVTADTSSLRAQMAVAQADMRAFGAEMRRVANDVRGAGGDIKGQLTAQLEALSARFERASNDARKFGNEIKSALKPSGGNPFEGLTEGLSSLTAIKSHLTEIAELSGIAFAVERIADWSLEAAEAGEKAANMAAAMGTSTERFSELSGAMQLVGGSGDSLVRTMQILAQKTEESLQQPMSKASDAFAKLGVTTEELREGLKDPTTLINALADGFRRLEEAGRGGEAIAALRAIMGRGNAEAVKLLRGGPEELQRLIAVAHEVGAVIDNDLGKKMVETTEKVHKLGEAFAGLKNAIYEGVRDPLNDSLDILTKMVTEAGNIVRTSGKGAWNPAWGPVPDALNGTSPEFQPWGDMRWLFRGASEPGGMRSGLDLIEQYESGGRNIPNYRYDKHHTAGGYFQLTDTNWRQLAPELGIDLGMYSKAMMAPYDEQRAAAGLLYSREGFAPWANFNPGLRAAIGGGGERSFSQMDEALKASWEVQKRQAERQMQDAQRRLTSGDTGAQGNYDAATAKLKALIAEEARYGAMATDPSRRDELMDYVTENAPAATAASIKAADATGQLREQQQKLGEELAKHDFDKAFEAVTKEIANAGRALAGFKADMASLAARGTMTPQQASGFDIQQIARTRDASLDLVNGLHAKAVTPDENKRTDELRQQIVAASDAASREAQKQWTEAGEKAAEAFATPFRSAFDRIGSTFESGIAGLLTRSTTGRKFEQSLFSAIVGGGVNILGSTASKIGGSLLGGKQGQGVGDVVGDKLGGWVTQLISNTLGLSLNTAAITANTAAQGAGAAGSVAGGALSAAGNAGGIFSAVSSIGSFFGFAKGGIVPSAAGGWALPNFSGGTPALLHGGEMVLPRDLSQGMQGMIRGGGSGDTHLHIHGNIVDAPAVARFFSDNKGHIMNALKSGLRGQTFGGLARA